MQNEVRLPRLLNGSMQEERRLYPSALSLTLMKNAVSTAHMALPEEDGLPPVLSFVEIYTLKGSAGLFRVSQQDTPATGNGGIDLLHAICTLHDSVWNNQLDANGNLLETDFEGTVAEYMAAILAKQRTARWQLGTCEDTGDWKKSGLNHDHLDDLLMEMAQDRAGYMLAYDFSTTPWTVSFVACADSVNAECRLTRNMKDGRKRSMRTGMVNRLYLTIKSEEKKDTAPETWSGGPDQGEPTGIVTADEDKVTETGVTYRVYDHLASQAEHGVMEGTAEIDLADVPDVDDWVAAFFRDHAQPISQASADAYELVKATGEPWDQYDLGKYARIALKRDGFPAEGPIEQIRYADLLAEPEKAQVDLTRKLPKFSERLSSLKSAQDAAQRGGGGGGGAAKAKEVTHWAQVVQHILEELEGTGIRQLWETGIELDAEQGATIYSVYEGLGYQAASITVANEYIRMLVTKTGVDGLDENTTLYSMILQTAQGLQAKFVDGLNSLRSYVELTASALRAAFDDEADSLRSYVELTASTLRAAFDDEANSLRSYVELTASALRATFDDEANSLRSYVELTASALRAAFDDEANSLRSYVELTASTLRAAFDDEANSLRSYVELTASALRAAFDDEANSLRSYVQITAASLRSEFTDDVTSLRSVIEQTAGGISAVVSDVASIKQSGLWINRDSVVSAVGRVTNLEGRVTTLEGSVSYLDDDEIALLIGAISVTPDYVQDTNGIYKRTWNAQTGQYDYEIADSSYTGVRYRLDSSAAVGDALHVKNEYIQDENGDYKRSWNSYTQQYEYTIAESGYTGARYRLERNVHVQEGVGLKIDRTVGGQTASFGVYDQNNLTAGFLISMINGQSQAQIRADKIDLAGYVTASTLETELARLANVRINGSMIVSSPALYQSTLGVTGDVTSGGNVVGAGGQFTNLYFGSGGDYSAMDAVTSIGPVAVSGGQISIPWARFSGAQTPINFNIADTQFYQDAVSAAYINGSNEAKAHYHTLGTHYWARSDTAGGPWTPSGFGEMFYYQ